MASLWMLSTMSCVEVEGAMVDSGTGIRTRSSQHESAALPVDQVRPLFVSDHGNQAFLLRTIGAHGFEEALPDIGLLLAPVSDVTDVIHNEKDKTGCSTSLHVARKNGRDVRSNTKLKSRRPPNEAHRTRPRCVSSCSAPTVSTHDRPRVVQHCSSQHLGSLGLWALVPLYRVVTVQLLWEGGSKGIVC